MKNGFLGLVSVSLFFLYGCQNAKNSRVKRDSYDLIRNPAQCFTAVFQKDSAFLKIKTTPDGKIQGRLIIKYGELEPLAMEKEYYRGIITGKFSRDTLFADYLFTDGDKKEVYKNPIALLKKDNKLVLGYGVTINYLGRTWFRDHSAINFEKCRFQFSQVECYN